MEQPGEPPIPSGRTHRIHIPSRYNWLTSRFSHPRACGPRVRKSLGQPVIALWNGWILWVLPSEIGGSPSVITKLRYVNHPLSTSSQVVTMCYHLHFQCDNHEITSKICVIAPKKKNQCDYKFTKWLSPRKPYFEAKNVSNQRQTPKFIKSLSLQKWYFVTKNLSNHHQTLLSLRILGPTTRDKSW